DSSYIDSPDTPPPPTHEIPSVEVALPSSQFLPASPSVRRRRVPILLPEQPIPHGPPYRYHPNGPVHRMTTRKRVGLRLTYCLAVRHSVNYSSLYHFTFDDSSRDSPSSSSSETSSDSFIDALSDSSSSHSSLGHIDADVERSDETYLEPDIDLEIQAEIDECITYVDALRAKEIDVRVVVETIDLDEDETGVRGLVKVRVDRVTHPVVSDDIPELTQEGAVEVTYKTLGDL
nr:hypothetical protein [Tanacetum cinerariifolium]